MLAPCDFCNTKLAVLYCQPDYAKLCLFCDQRVHTDNALSLKHVRSQICENCVTEPVSVRCSTENLMLCQGCDWDSHSNCSVSCLHERFPVEGFSGCPSVIELAAFFDLDIKAENLMNMGSGFGVYEPKILNSQELVVPEQSCSVFVSCENYKQEVYEQLMEMCKTDLVILNGDGDQLEPGTPPSRCSQQGYTESLEVENIDEEQLLHQQTPFSSLLMFPPNIDLRDNDFSFLEGDLMWVCNPAYQAAQVGAKIPLSLIAYFLL